jgi:hypothetical protein
MTTKYIKFEGVKYPVKKGDFIRICKHWSFGMLRIAYMSFNTGDDRTLFINEYSGTLIKRLPINDKQLKKIDLESMEIKESIYQGTLGEQYYTDYIFSEGVE